MGQWFQQLLDSIVKAFSDFGAWLIEQLKELMLWAWAEVLSGLGELITAIPVPDWLSSAASSFGSIPAGVIWFVDPFDIPFGLTTIISAYVLRFAIRRLPLVG